jgi:predicted acylesterase/phospholipase RssA/CRP-like cAMP-binding protein
LEPARPNQVQSTAERLDLLAGRHVCQGLDPRALEDLDAALESVHVPRGTRFVQRGQPRVPFIVVAHGGLRASHVDADGRRRVLLEYFRGSTLGEALVLSGRSAPFDVDAIRDSHLLSLSPERFNELGARHPELVLHFARTVATRVVDILDSRDVLTSFARRSDGLPRSVALVSTAAEGARRMRDLVCDALFRSRTATRLTTEDARRAMDEVRKRGENVDHEPFLVEWLSRHEARCDIVILECEPTRDTLRVWLDFCLRQADRIMVLASDEDTTRSDGDLAWWRDAGLGERSRYLGLSIVHARSDGLPRGGPSYARLPGVSRLHHVRAGDPRDAESLARWLLDRPVGLVLGGGGAHGIAHVGVVKALEEARVPVDVVGGTSMGAIFAGGLARGWSADTVMDRVRSLFSSRFALYDPTIPLCSLLAGRKLDRVLGEFFRDIDMADLWTPFFCVSTNLSRACSEVHDRGSLQDAIRSSCSIPGLFPPFQLLRQLLVDGGLVDNLPIGAMAYYCRGPIIAVDVFSNQRREEGRGHGSRRGLFERLRGLRPSSTMRPWLFEVLMHATLASSQHATQQSLSSHPPALYLVPDLARFRVLDWRAYEALFQAGYTSAKRALEAGELPRSLWEGRIEDSRSQTGGA